MKPRIYAFIDSQNLNLGVKSAKTSYAKQETEVEFDEEKILPQKIIEQIKKTGYKASRI